MCNTSSKLIMNKQFNSILDNASAIILCFPLICLISKLYRCIIKLYLSIFWFLSFMRLMKTNGLCTVKTITGNLVTLIYRSKCCSGNTRA